MTRILFVLLALIFSSLVLSGRLSIAQERANSAFPHSGIEDVTFKQQQKQQAEQPKQKDACKPALESFDYSSSGKRECEIFEKDFLPGSSLGKRVVEGGKLDLENSKIHNNKK